MTAISESVEGYLAALPDDRREVLTAVREAIRKSLPEGYEEGFQYGMISYHVPHSLFPDGYHCNPKEPLPFLMIASQKGYLVLHMFAHHIDGEAIKQFEAAWRATGKKLDIGKACVRFKRVEDIPLEVLGDTIRQMPVEAFLASYVAKRPAKGKAKG